MTTAIDLCRRALMRLGTQSGITAFDDGSVEASVCAAYYDDVLQRKHYLMNGQMISYLWGFLENLLKEHQAEILDSVGQLSCS
ncbi:hypothetical protein [Bombella apis]|uniref:hypothetical protein n=1 Tax=Bombella apis TaxID=1785988 RepID=UPI0012B90D57|nr:hypothetical protein [Bombella apis]MPW00419.1 hypothetical protein [Bombella apis]